MRQHIIVVRRHGETKFELLKGPEVPIHEQLQFLRDGQFYGKTHPDFAEVLGTEFDRTGGTVDQRAFTFAPEPVQEAPKPSRKAAK